MIENDYTPILGVSAAKLPHIRNKSQISKINQPFYELSAQFYFCFSNIYLFSQQIMKSTKTYINQKKLTLLWKN